MTSADPNVLTLPGGGSPDEAAAYWQAKQVLGTMTAAERRLFDAWILEPAHADAYRLIDDDLARFEALRDLPEIDAMRVAALENVAVTGVDRRGVLGAVAAAAAAVMIGGVWWRSAGRSRPVTGPTPPATVAASSGGRMRSERLADGSLLTVDRGSEVRITMADDARRLDLVRGRARIQVAHDPDRPLSMRAGTITVTATGTDFAMDLLPDRVTIALLEGGVKVQEEGAEPRAMRAGQVVVARAGGKPVVDPRRTAEAATAWTKGMIVMRDMPLDDALQEMNRYAARPIALGEPALAVETVTGIFHVGEERAFLRALAVSHGITAREGKEATRLYRTR